MKVAVYGQKYNPDDKTYVVELFQSLKKLDVICIVEENFLRELSVDMDNTEYTSFGGYEDLDDSFDFMFTLGGDGTILRAVNHVQNLDIPIVGINTGRMGFLATIHKEAISKAVEQIINGEFQLKERTLLSVSTVPQTDNMNFLNFALNEVTVSRKNTPSMITVETYVDDEYLTSYWADGLIIATPTGSTGYSLSCGGPIITPRAKSFALTPIAPHNLNARPLVVPDDTKIRLKVHGREDAYFLSLDSRIISVSNETIVTIEKADFKLKMAELKDRTFIKTLREKLLWGLDTRN